MSRSPSTLMKLAGAANWWAPAWARRLHTKVGLDESGGALSTESPETAMAAEKHGTVPEKVS